jgi:hypothetical protein
VPPPKVSRKPRTTKKNTNADGDYVDQNDETIYDHEIDLVPNNNNNNNNNDAIQLDAYSLDHVINALSKSATNQPVNQTPSKTTIRLWSNAETGMLLLLWLSSFREISSRYSLFSNIFSLFDFILFCNIIHSNHLAISLAMSKEGVEFTPGQIKNKLETTGILPRITEHGKPKVGSINTNPTRMFLSYLIRIKQYSLLRNSLFYCL